jgi:hypothetical protein
MREWLRSKLVMFLHPPTEKMSINAVRANDDIDMDNCIRFQVMTARGGTIIQTSHYDQKTDRHTRTTHIIPEGDDIAERVGQIVSLELLSH